MYFIRSKPKWIRIVLAIILIVIIILVSIILVLRILYSVPTLSGGIDKYVSRTDESNQQAINKLTNFNWLNFPTKFDNTEKQMLAALLLLYNEESAVFYPEIQNVSISAADTKELGIIKLTNEPNSENLTKLIDNLIAIQNKYSSLGIIPAKTHSERLVILKKYFSRNSINSSHKIPDGAKDISESVRVASNQKEYAEKILSRYNNWLALR